MINGFSNTAELAAGSVFGIRCWYYEPANHTLTGMFCQRWEKHTDTYIATCQRKHSFLPLSRVDVHQTPAPPEIDCGCGFYAYWHVDDVMAPSYGCVILGVIEGFGRTLLGTRGFRSEKARISGLHVPQRSSLTALSDLIGELLALEYAVPVYSSLPELLEACPVTQDYYDPAVNHSQQKTWSKHSLLSMRQLLDECTSVVNSANRTLTQSKKHFEDILRDLGTE